MPVRVLGCAGSIAAGNRTTAFLVDDDILIDAGTGVGDLTLDELTRIDHIFVTHSHLDHVLTIPLLADSVMRRRQRQQRPPVRVHALPQTLAALRDHVLNGVIWPDFTRLPSSEHPVLALEPLQVGEVVTLGARRIEALPAAHTVPAVGYAVSAVPGSGQAEGSAQSARSDRSDRSDQPSAPAWVYTGDTGPNPALWARLATLPVAALVIETAFRDDQHQLAQVSQHLCPTTLRAELEQLPGAADVFITHIKPGELDRVMTEIGSHASRHRIQALVAGQVMTWGVGE